MNTQPQGRNPLECFTQPSLLSAAQCIQSEFLLKTRTNFYIPKDAYVGYSYLNEELPHNAQHHHRPHLFVAAEPTLEGLHAHQWQQHQSQVFPSFNASDDPTLFLSRLNHVKPSAITIPYIHPYLQRPVPPLILPKYFGALCFSFTFGGIMMLYWIPKWTRGHWFPYRLFAWILILFQGPCSFLADYIHMTNNSAWHLVDRFLACLLMAMEITKLIALRPYTHPRVYLLYLVSMSFAIGCFVKSQESQKKLDTDGFIFWHCGWHCYPFLCAAVVGFERWVISQYADYPSKYKRGEGGGMLLSTMVLKYFSEKGEKQVDTCSTWKKARHFQVRK